MKSSDNLPDNKSSSSDWDYNYILSWISDATRMNKQEFENWREIKELQRLDPNFINRYLGILKSEEKVQKMEMQNINKKRELLNLLNDTEKKIIAEIVKGTDFDKIYQEVGISAKTFPHYMSGIYKKTRDIIPYDKRIKRTALMEYLSQDSASEQRVKRRRGDGVADPPAPLMAGAGANEQDCEFERGEIIQVPEKLHSCQNPRLGLLAARPAQRSSRQDEFASLHSCQNPLAEDEKDLNNPDCNETESILEQNAKVLENELVKCGIEHIQDSLITVRDFLRGKYKEFCEKLGDMLVQGTPQMALESTDYTQAKDYDNAIGVLNCSLAELKTKAVTKQGE